MIDEVPLEWCLGDGVVLRFRDKGEGETVSAEDVEDELLRIGYEIKPFEIASDRQTGSDELVGNIGLLRGTSGDEHSGDAIPQSNAGPR